MNSELNQYVTFMKETLGVQSILTVDAKNTSTTVTEIVKNLIAVESLTTYEKAEHDLLEKMILALKLNQSEFKVCDENQLNLFSAERIIILKNSPSQQNETYSPRVLLKQPDLKRKTWDDLKLWLGQS